MPNWSLRVGDTINQHFDSGNVNRMDAVNVMTACLPPYSEAAAACCCSSSSPAIAGCLWPAASSARQEYGLVLRLMNKLAVVI